MFCSECGDKLVDQAKFCSNCGTKVAREAANSPETPTAAQEPPPAAPSPGNQAKRQAIIDSVDVNAMQDMARRALSTGDANNANFWYLEWITAPGVPRSTLVEGINEYTEKVLLQESRFAEAELYLTWIAEAGDASEQAAATAALQKLHQLRGSRGMKRHRSGKEWTKIDVSLPLDPNWTSEMQYRRAIAWLEAKSSTADMAPLLDCNDPQYLPYLAGVVIGLRDGLAKIGADTEAAVQGVQDWIRYRQDEQERARAREREAEVRASRPKPVPQPKQAKPAATRNSLGEHIDKLFTDRKFAEQIKAAMGCTTGLNDDVVVAAIPVSEKLGDGEDSNHQMIFTYDKAAIVKKGGLFSSSEAKAFTRNQIEYIGIGDSDHYEGQGFGGRSTNWVSLTISLKNGLTYTRHYLLGSSEKEINSNIPYLRDALERMGRVGYRIEDGPGWSSSGGYHTSVSYGIGFWR